MVIMKSIDEIKPTFIKGYAPGKDIESGLALMRSQGFSQMECVRALVSVVGLALPEADIRVLHSKPWEDQKDATLQLRNNFFDALESMSGEDLNDL